MILSALDAFPIVDHPQMETRSARDVLCPNATAGGCLLCMSWGWAQSQKCLILWGGNEASQAQQGCIQKLNSELEDLYILAGSGKLPAG